MIDTERLVRKYKNIPKSKLMESNENKLFLIINYIYLNFFALFL